MPAWPARRKSATSERGWREIQDLVISCREATSVAVGMVPRSCAWEALVLVQRDHIKYRQQQPELWVYHSHVAVLVCFTRVQSSQAGVSTQQGKVLGCNGRAAMFWRAHNSLGTDHLDNPTRNNVGQAAGLCCCFKGRASLHTPALRAPYSDSCACSCYPRTVKTTGKDPGAAVKNSSPCSPRAMSVRAVEPQPRLLQHVHVRKDTAHLLASTRCAPAVTAPDRGMLATGCRTGSMLRRGVLDDKGKL